MKLTRVSLLVLSITLSAQGLFAAENLKLAQELPGVWAGKAAWADYDQDGYLDLALTGTVIEDGTPLRIARIYRNTGDAGGGLLDPAPAQDLTGVYYGDLAWGDYDDDGDLDLAIAGWASDGSETLRLYRNQPTGTLVLDQQETEVLGVSGLVGVRYASLSWQDFDNDADLDLIVAGMNSNGVSLTQLYTNENGTFAPEEFNSESILNVQNGDLAWGDWDNDGDADLLVTGDNVSSLGESNTVSEFYENDPTGTLSPDASLSITAVKGGSIAWSDYDDDGNLDLAVSGWTRPWEIDFSVYQNRPTGLLTLIDMNAQFVASTSDFVAGELAWVDYDNDGDQDLATSGVPNRLAAGLSNRTDYLSVVHANDNGVFSASETLDLPIAGGSTTWGDYDLDGRIDLFTSGTALDGQRRSVIYHNEVANANSAPTAPAEVNDPKITGSRLIFSWLPGTDDLSSKLTYNLSVGSAERTLSAEQVAAGLSPTSDDIFTGSVEVGPGNAGFQTTMVLDRSLADDVYYWSVQSIDGSFARSAWTQAELLRVEPFVDSDQRLRDLLEAEMAWGDYDGDGDPDLAIMGKNRNKDTQTLIYENADGELGVRLDADIFGASSGDLAWGDYDRDGDLDLVITGADKFDNRRTFLYENDEGSFAVARDLDQVSTGAVDWGDADNDGDLDLALFGLDATGTAVTKVYFNDGSGLLPDDTVTELIGLFDGEAAWADFNNDGDLDLALSGASADGQQLLVYGNDPPGTLASPVALTGIESSDLAIGDYDGDGDLDLFAGGNTGSALTTTLYQNDSGVLTELAGTDFPGIRGGDLVLGDYDNDQFMDLVIVGNNGSAPFMSIYRNRLGSLETPDTPFEVDGNLADLQSTQGVDFSAVSMSDIDGDGDLDLFSAGRFDLINATPLTTVNDNIVAATNILPGIPPDVTEVVLEDAVTFSWGSATEAPVPHAVTYNLRVGTEPESHDILSGNVPLGPGNAGSNFTHRLHGLASGTYYWSVQSVDDGFARSAWSTPSPFIIDTVRPETAAPTFSRVRAGIGQTITTVLAFEDAHSGIDPAVEPVVTATIADETYTFQQLQFSGTSWSGELTITGEMPSGVAGLTVANVADQLGNEIISVTTDAAFEIDTVVPAVAVSSPNTGEEGVPSTTSVIAITLSEPIDPQTASAENFNIEIDNQPVSLLAVPEYDGDVTVRLLPDGGLRPGTLYTVQVAAGIQDLFGNRPATDSTWTFSTVVPDTSSVSPAAGAIGIAAAAVEIGAIFDSPLLADQVTTDNVQLLQEGEALSINPTYIAESQTISLNPDAPIRPGTPYQVFISGAVGGPLRQALGDVRWSFSTEIPDTTSVIPAAGSVGVVAADAQINATFDSPLLRDRVTAETVQLLREGESVTAIPSYDSESNSITLTPADGLRPGTPYQIFVSGAIGGPLRQAQGDVRWDFSTQIPDTASVSPAAGAVGVVAADARIVAVFDSPLLQDQITAENVQLLREGEVVSATPIYDVDSRSISLNPELGLKPGTPYQIFVSGAVGGPLRQATGDVRWDFNTLVPTIDSFSPTADEEVSSGSRRIAVNFTSPIDEDLVTPDRFRLSQGGVSVPLNQSGFNYLEESQQVLLPSVELEPGSQYEVTVSAQVSGPLGAEVPDQQWTFTTRVPQLVNSSPAAGAVGVDIDDGDFTVQFDTPPSSAVESDGVVQLFAQGEAVPLGPITFLDDNTINFEPVEDDLNPGTTYQVRIGADAGGPRQADDYVWDFTTAIPDTQSVSPSPKATDVVVPLNAVQVTFTSAIDEDVLETAGNVILLESGTQIASSVAVDETSVTITATDGFRAGTLYEVLISGAVGGPLRQALGDFRWNFSTRVPDIAGISPGEAEEVEAGDRRIAVTFTSAIDADLAVDPELFQLSQGGNRISLESQDYDYDEGSLQVQFPNVTLEPGSQYEVSVSSQVRGPIGADQGDRQWTFNTSVPELLATTPSAGAADVAADSASIRVQFDAPPASGIDQPGVVQLLALGEAVTLGEVSFLDDRTITFAPASGNLRAGTPYQVQIAASAGGPRRAEDYEWTFNTVVPALDSVSPAADVDVSAAELDVVEITFSAPIDADKADATRFTLASNGQAVPLREGDPIPLGDDGRAFALAPADDWQVGSSYTLLLSADLSGPLGSGQAVTSQFTTAVPSLALTSPEDRNADVTTSDAEITIGFDIPPAPAISTPGVIRLSQQGDEVSLSEVTFVDERTVRFQPTAGILRAGTQYQVTIDASAGGPRRDQDYGLSFSTIVPELQSVTPTADADVNAGDLTQIEIAFSAAIDADKADADHFTLTRNGEAVALRDDDPVALDSDSRNFGLAPAAGWLVGSAYVLQITPDVSGPLGSAQSETSQFTTAVPQLEQVTPDAGSDVVSPLDGTITVQFDIPPDASINDAGVIQFVQQGEAAEISAVSSIDDRTVTFEPVDGLRAGTRYQVFIPSSVGGPRQTQAYTWQFSTQVPGLVSTTPGLREANVNIDSSLIVVEFTAPVDRELLTPANFALFREGDAVDLAEGDPRELEAGRYGLAPATGLLVGSSYSLQIAPVVTGPLGVDQPIVTTFSTAFPSMVDVVPAIGAADVATSDSRISIVFDNPVDAAAAVDSANIDLLWESTPVAISPPSYTEDPFTLSFEPVGGLVAGSNYIVRIDGSIGGPLRQEAGDFVWRFSTRLPFLADTRPTNGAEGVSTSTPTIQMIFSDPIASQDAGNFQLFEQRLGAAEGPQGGPRNPRILAPITGFGAEGDTVISFTPQGGLRPSTEYTVFVGRDVLGPLATSGDSLVFQTAGRLENAAGGGRVENPEGSVAIYFPPNAIDAAAEVIIRRLRDEVSEKAATQDDELTRISPAYLIDAGGIPLRKPVTLSMRYPGDGSDPASLSIFRLADDENWSRVGGTAETGQPLLRTAIEELGTFAIFEDLSVPVGRLSVQDLDCQPRAFSPRTGDKRETDISFTLTGPADVTVRVYNASGRLERVIERNRPMSQGRVLLTWNGEDEEREAVPSGLYIVVVNAGGAQKEKVISVVR